MNVHMNNVSAVALVDSGATGVFMHPDFAKRCNATIRLKATPREVRVIDGRVISSGLITHEATVDLAVGGHQEKLLADITNTGRYNCILGIPWLARHDPTIRWSQRKVLFDSLYCQHTCFSGLLQEEGHEEKPTNHRLRTIDSNRVSPTDFYQLTREAAVYCLEISEVTSVEPAPIPAVYADLSNAFSEEAANELPNHGPADMKIEFKEGQEPRNTGLRPISPIELEELRHYLEENLGKG